MARSRSPSMSGRKLRAWTGLCGLPPARRCDGAAPSRLRAVGVLLTARVPSALDWSLKYPSPRRFMPPTEASAWSHPGVRRGHAPRDGDPLDLRAVEVLERLAGRRT